MWHIKTDKERYEEYMKAVSEMKYQVKELEKEKAIINSYIIIKERRIQEIQEMADYYAPKTP